MTSQLQRLTAFLNDGAPAVFVKIIKAEGSTPRNADAYLLVKINDFFGTIGGGQLEFHAIAVARQMLVDGEAAKSLDVALGPHLGQCCGGRVELQLTSGSASLYQSLYDGERRAASQQPHIAIFGCGHTGKALCVQLSQQPFSVSLIDDREDAFEGSSFQATRIWVPDPTKFVDTVPASAAFIILTHSHSLDYSIAAAALKREDSAYVGMIGSATKRALFSRWFLQTGGTPAQLEHLTCPIGGNEIVDKRPQIIAALTIAQIIGIFARY